VESATLTQELPLQLIVNQPNIQFMQDDILEIVDENNNVTGTALRKECHGNPKLIHRTAHVIVVNDKDEILLQKRSMNKDIQPGKWDTAVGGHFDPGENAEQAVRREMNEELGIPKDSPIIFLFEMKIRNDIESENVSVYKLISNGPFKYQEEEIDEIKFWTKEKLLPAFRKNIITPMCERELKVFFNL
jgi:isopentenyldiphosphate isomerase